MRAFVGIALTDALRRVLGTRCETLVDTFPAWKDARWVAPENLHVTVAFLGSIGAHELDEVFAALRIALAEATPFALSPGTIVARPSARRATMLWATLEYGRDETAALISAVTGALSARGFEIEDRPPRPHITLVRFRRPQRVDEAAVARVCEDTVASRMVPSMSVHRVTVFSSTLTPDGPLYDVVEEVPFGQR